MSKTTAPSAPETELPLKKPRRGVGTSVVVSVDEKETDSLVLCLTQIKVERLQPRNRAIIACERSDSLPRVFQKMVENTVLSLPVLTKPGKYCGLVDMLDIVRFVTELFQDFTNASMVTLETMFTTDARFSNAIVAEILKSPRQKPASFHTVPKGYSLFSAWEILALSGAHRVPVVDPFGQVVDLITQSMLIDFLWQNVEKIGRLAEKQIKDMTTPRSNVVLQCQYSSRAIVGFREMVQKGIGYLAIVDDNGRLIDNLSLRDLRGIRPDVKVFYRLWSSVAEFKEKVREEFAAQTPLSLLYAVESHTLYQVLEMMAVEHVHQVFVVDNTFSMKPIYAITQTDVLREVLGK